MPCHIPWHMPWQVMLLCAGRFGRYFFDIVGIKELQTWFSAAMGPSEGGQEMSKQDEELMMFLQRGLVHKKRTNRRACVEVLPSGPCWAFPLGVCWFLFRPSAVSMLRPSGLNQERITDTNTSNQNVSTTTSDLDTNYKESRHRLGAIPRAPIIYMAVSILF